MIKKILIASAFAAMPFFLPVIAQADLITTVSDVSYSNDLGAGLAGMFNVRNFNSQLGKLTGVSFTFGGNLQTDIALETPLTYQSAYVIKFTNFANVYVDGLSNPSTPSESVAGFSTYISSSYPLSNFTGSGPVSSTFNVPSSALGDYVSSSTNSSGFTGEFGFASIATVDGRNLGTSSPGYYFQGKLTQTDTYTPVPEPGSLPVLATGVLFLGLAYKRRRN